MKALQALEAARAASTPDTSRPATALLLDSPDARVVVFRIAAGQEVPPHRSSSTVLLTVLSGTGILSGEDTTGPVARACGSGDVVAYEPNELHGMRATDGELLLLATITPRPGQR